MLKFLTKFKPCIQTNFRKFCSAPNENPLDKNPELKKILEMIQMKMIKVTEEITEHSAMEELVNSMNTSDLCYMAIHNFVGSMQSPRNHFLIEYFLDRAARNARNKDDQHTIEYFKAYITKLDSIETNESEKYSQANSKLLDLANESHPVACVHNLIKLST